MHITVKYCIKCEQLNKFILKTVHSIVPPHCNCLCTAETGKSGNVTSKQQAPPNTHTLPKYSYLPAMLMLLSAGLMPRPNNGHCWKKSSQSLQTFCGQVHEQTVLHTHTHTMYFHIKWMGAVPQSPAPAPHW